MSGWAANVARPVNAGFDGGNAAPSDPDTAASTEAGGPGTTGSGTRASPFREKERHQMRYMAAAFAAGLLLLAGCAGSGPPQLPAARALATAMGCTVLAGAGSQFDSLDVRQDVLLGGTAPGCTGELYTFPSAGAKARWLRQAAASANTSVPAVYPWFVVGGLWAVNLTGATDVAAVAGELHGKQVTF